MSKSNPESGQPPIRVTICPPGPIDPSLSYDHYQFERPGDCIVTAYCPVCDSPYHTLLDEDDDLSKWKCAECGAQFYPD